MPICLRYLSRFRTPRGFSYPLPLTAPSSATTAAVVLHINDSSFIASTHDRHTAPKTVRRNVLAVSLQDNWLCGVKPLPPGLPARRFPGCTRPKHPPPLAFLFLRPFFCWFVLILAGSCPPTTAGTSYPRRTNTSRETGFCPRHTGLAWWTLV